MMKHFTKAQAATSIHHFKPRGDVDRRIAWTAIAWMALIASMLNFAAATIWLIYAMYAWGMQ